MASNWDTYNERRREKRANMTEEQKEAERLEMRRYVLTDKLLYEWGRLTAEMRLRCYHHDR